MTDTPEDSPVVITALGVQTNQFNELLAKDDFSAAIEVCEQMLKDMEPEQKHWRDLRAQAQMAQTRASHLAYVDRMWTELDRRIELMTEHHEEYLEELRAEYGRGLEGRLYGWSARGDEEYLCTERHMIRSSGAITFCTWLTDEAEEMHLHWATGKHGPEDKSYLDLYPKFHGIYNHSGKIHRPGHAHAGDNAGEPMYYINDKLAFTNRGAWRHIMNLCGVCYPRKNKCEEHMIPKGLDGNCGACVAFFTG
jgi:hypothetical protein